MDPAKALVLCIIALVGSGVSNGQHHYKAKVDVIEGPYVSVGSKSQLICEKTTANMKNVTISQHINGVPITHFFPDPKIINITQCRVNENINEEFRKNYRCIPGQSSQEHFFKPKGSDYYLKATFSALEPIMNVCDAVYVGSDSSNAGYDDARIQQDEMQSQDINQIRKRFPSIYNSWPEGYYRPIALTDA